MPGGRPVDPEKWKRWIRITRETGDPYYAGRMARLSPESVRRALNRDPRSSFWRWIHDSEEAQKFILEAAEEVRSA